MTELSKDALRRLADWLCSLDTGTSSMTMACIAIGGEHGLRWDAPYDSSDFGRCYRLLQKVPEIREHFGRIGELAPEFAHILADWDELSAMYEVADSRHEHKAISELIKELREKRSKQTLPI